MLANTEVEDCKLNTVGVFTTPLPDDSVYLYLDRSRLDEGESNQVLLTSGTKTPLIFASVLIHLIILVTLALASKNIKLRLPKNTTEIKTIKSYLYRVPKPAKPKVKKNQRATPIALDNKSSSNRTEPNKSKVIVKAIKKVKHNATKNTLTIKKPKQVQEFTGQNKKAKDTAAKPAFSSSTQLLKLQTAINEQIMKKEFEQRTVKRSASIMHAPQIPVPHSVVPLTTEQKREKTTSQFGAGKITKNDNGSCTITREQMLGSPIEASVSHFACGESKFDKNFREHMEKVQQKLAPVN